MLRLSLINVKRKQDIMSPMGAMSPTSGPRRQIPEALRRAFSARTVEADQFNPEAAQDNSPYHEDLPEPPAW
jgi:hypothetical protein